MGRSDGANMYIRSGKDEQVTKECFCGSATSQSPADAGAGAGAGAGAVPAVSVLGGGALCFFSSATALHLQLDVVCYAAAQLATTPSA